METLHKYISNFRLTDNTHSTSTVIEDKILNDYKIRYYINEFWTPRQRQASSLHEVSYRACFKPRLPAFFIDLLTERGDVVYDPFSGRGTTALQAVLMGRTAYANDINPLSRILAEPRMNPPELKDVENRLSHIPFNKKIKSDLDLSMFYHPVTLCEILSLRTYLIERREKGSKDNLDAWIRMVATNRLSGHSPGFFSVYTLPPNQAVSPSGQLKINKKRRQEPEYRDVKKLILRKSSQLLKRLTDTERENLRVYGKASRFYTMDARKTRDIPDHSVRLTVTSPPFLNIVNYSGDNWLRCWFNGIDDQAVAKKITMSRTPEDWEKVMSDVFHELYRITIPGGWVVFEVGEVRHGTVQLEKSVIPLGLKAGFSCFGVLINDQKFTKTSNIWGINNNIGGTNTNRIVVFYK